MIAGNHWIIIADNPGMIAGDHWMMVVLNLANFDYSGVIKANLWAFVSHYSSGLIGSSSVFLAYF
jgi:hypothetical protein